MYLIAAIYYSEEKNQMERNFTSLLHQIYEEKILTVSNRWREFCVHLVRKKTDVRKLGDSVLSLHLQIIYTGRSYTDNSDDDLSSSSEGDQKPNSAKGELRP